MIFICRVCFHLLRVGTRLRLPREARYCAFCLHELEELDDERP